MVDLGFTNEIAKIASTDLFKRDGRENELQTGLFVGRPFYLDYDRAHLLVADSWKMRAKGLPQGSFLLAYYENEPDVSGALLLRVLRACYGLERKSRRNADSTVVLVPS